MARQLPHDMLKPQYDSINTHFGLSPPSPLSLIEIQRVKWAAGGRGHATHSSRSGNRCRREGTVGETATASARQAPDAPPCWPTPSQDTVRGRIACTPSKQPVASSRGEHGGPRGDTLREPHPMQHSFRGTVNQATKSVNGAQTETAADCWSPTFAHTQRRTHPLSWLSARRPLNQG